MVIFGLGSNLGDRFGYLKAAVSELAPMLTGLRLSRVLESKALLSPSSSPEMDLPYLNMALSGHTHLAPHALLTEIKRIELELGRIRRGHWAPREIDIDILAMGELVADTPVLTLPHRGLLTRDFALLPLTEVAPQWKYPVKGPYYGCYPGEIVAMLGFSLNANLRDSGLSIDDY